jgi:2,3-bisphosphoglycerate-dependent phosphoglycerate mutase
MNLILVRHGESESNIDNMVHEHTADHAIPLTNKGVSQAVLASEKVQTWIRKNLSASDRIRLWKSPYERTVQTAAPFENITWEGGSKIIQDVKEDVVLCEQQFGLFDGLSDEELKEKYPNEYAHYEKCENFEGKFWARMPLGESRFDVTCRVHQMFGTWQRDRERHGINTVIVVSHGVTIRAIIMRWLHHPVKWFENEPNPKNCSIRIIRDGVDEGYLND